MKYRTMGKTGFKVSETGFIFICPLMKTFTKSNNILLII